MLPLVYRAYDSSADSLPTLQKQANGADAGIQNAFPCGTVLTFSLTVPRRLGAAAVRFRCWSDETAQADRPLEFVCNRITADVYALTLDTKALCSDRLCGLFFYTFVFVRGNEALYCHSPNNVDFTLAAPEENPYPFRLLLYRADFCTPAWFYGATVYHIFIDRFYRGNGAVFYADDATLQPDWEHGIPSYAPVRGGFIENKTFFGGNLWGILEKLPYLVSLGVNVLYLSPLFTAASNHKYDTGDYETVDAGFGGEPALTALLAGAAKQGVRLILDGVFNHTGDDSRYFNRYGKYASVGACQSPDSPYADWYTFSHFPNAYACWWDIPILPRLRTDNPAVCAYLAGENGVAASRVRTGIAGWRLDVADELDNTFLEALRRNLHKAAPAEQPLLIGEVWENAAEKIAYGVRRRYFLGEQLDSVMNYPLRRAILAFLLDKNATSLYNTIMEQCATYPEPVLHCLFNTLGTHDTARILTVLGDPHNAEKRTPAESAAFRLSTPARRKALLRLRQAFTLLFTLYGVPAIYYGDEAGMEGDSDPFCRKPYPWGHEDAPTVAHVRRLGMLRRTSEALQTGDFRVLTHGEQTLSYERVHGQDALLVLANAGDSPFTLSPGILRLSGPYEQLCANGHTTPARRLYAPAHSVVLYRKQSGTG